MSKDPHNNFLFLFLPYPLLAPPASSSQVLLVHSLPFFFPWKKHPGPSQEPA